MLILQVVHRENIKMFLGIKQTTEDDQEEAGNHFIPGNWGKIKKYKE